MLYHLLYPLKDFFFGFNVFRYITFRTVFASVTAFLLCVLLGPFLFRLIRRLRVSEAGIRDHAPSLDRIHRRKKGTPTMGGVVILFSFLGATLLWADVTNPYILLLLQYSDWKKIFLLINYFIKTLQTYSKMLWNI